MLRSVLGPDPALLWGTAMLVQHPTPLLTDVNMKTWAYSSAKVPHRWKLGLLVVMALLCPKCVMLYDVLCLPLCCMMYCAYHYAVWHIVPTIMLYGVFCLPLCCMVYCAYHYAVLCLPLCCMMYPAYHYAVWCILPTIMLYNVLYLPLCCMVYCAYHYAVWCILPTIMLYGVFCLPLCCTMYCTYHYAVWCILPTIMLYDVLCLPHWALRPVWRAMTGPACSILGWEHLCTSTDPGCQTAPASEQICQHNMFVKTDKVISNFSSFMANLPA